MHKAGEILNIYNERMGCESERICKKSKIKLGEDNKSFVKDWKHKLFAKNRKHELVIYGFAD